MRDFPIQQEQNPDQDVLSENDTDHMSELSQRREKSVSVLLCWIRRRFVWIGQIFRRHIRFLLIMLGAFWGVVFESLRVSSWRRSVRYEFVSTTNSIIKGPDADAELADAKKAISILGGHVEKVEKAQLEDFGLDHRIIFIKKVKNTPAKYPRKAGTPAKEPLK